MPLRSVIINHLAAFGNSMPSTRRLVEPCENLDFCTDPFAKTQRRHCGDLNTTFQSRFMLTTVMP
jgi:hypothetical protein